MVRFPLWTPRQMLQSPPRGRKHTVYFPPRDKLRTGTGKHISIATFHACMHAYNLSCHTYGALKRNLPRGLCMRAQPPISTRRHSHPCIDLLTHHGRIVACHQPYVDLAADSTIFPSELQPTLTARAPPRGCRRQSLARQIGTRACRGAAGRVHERPCGSGYTTIKAIFQTIY